MNKVHEDWVAGTPRFDDPKLGEIERRAGPAAAWRAAMDMPVDAGVARAQGHFAVGLRDEAGRTLLAVDRFATETVCWRVDGGRLRFAERADALADDRNDIDPQALFDYLFLHAIPSPRTIFKGVHRLPPGHCILHDGHGPVEVRRYWRPAFHEAATRFEDARDTFRRVLAESVQRDLDGSRPACFLSGGTDSSTVAGMICQVAGQPAASYSIGFDAEGYDEMEYARIAARHFGTEHHEHYLSPEVLRQQIPEVAAFHDQPFGNSSALPAYFCARQARADGVTRLLAGDGGDELFGGNTRYAKQSVFAWYGGIPGGLRSGLLEPIADGTMLDQVPLLKKGVSYVRQARVPMPDRLHGYNLLDRLGRENVLTPAFLHRIDPAGPQAQQREVWAECPDASFVNQMLAFDWRYTLAENDLPKVRTSTRAAGMAVGYPFLDTAVLDFSSRLPTDYKLRRLKLRWFFKEALRGFLPEAIITKKKHGFGLPFGVWVTRDAALAALARDSVFGAAERGIVREAFARALIERHLPEQPGYFGEMAWILMMLEQWFRHHAPDYRIVD